MQLIGSFYLYDNNLKSDYLILNNRRRKTEFKMNNGKVEIVETDEFSYDLPFEFISCSGALNKIFNLDKDDYFIEKSMSIMLEAAKKANVPMIKLKYPLILEKIGTTHLSNYNIYNIYYDTRNGDLGNYELAFAFNITRPSVCACTFHLYQFGNNFVL